MPKEEPPAYVAPGVQDNPRLEREQMSQHTPSAPPDNPSPMRRHRWKGTTCAKCGARRITVNNNDPHLMAHLGLTTRDVGRLYRSSGGTVWTKTRPDCLPPLDQQGAQLSLFGFVG